MLLRGKKKTLTKTGLHVQSFPFTGNYISYFFSFPATISFTSAVQEQNLRL